MRASGSAHVTNADANILAVIAISFGIEEKRYFLELGRGLNFGP